MHAALQAADGRGALFLQQLPCSWGALFFPQPWHAFHSYMRRRMLDEAPAVIIPKSGEPSARCLRTEDDASACTSTFFRWIRILTLTLTLTLTSAATNGWKTSWKKFLIELSYLEGYVVLYPNFPNQSSFSTNHLEPG